MSDDQEFDQSLCECVFSHEFAMRRLLSLLRNGQSVCTDNECTDLVHPQTAGAAAGSDSMDNFMFISFMMIAAVILYLIRPNSLRRRNNEGAAKSPRRDDDANDGNGPMVN